MNVLIQDIKTSEFLTHDNTWTKNPAEAENYGFSLTAHSTARMLNLQSYRILFYCPDTHYRIFIYSSEDTQPSPQSN
jgi:hypothetical protein